MFPGLGNPKQMQGMLKKMGISQEDISAERVIIERFDGDKIIIENPSITKIKMQGNESFQISGDISEIHGEPELFNEEDVKTVMNQTGISEEVVKETLEKNNGDLAETILELSE